MQEFVIRNDEFVTENDTGVIWTTFD